MKGPSRDEILAAMNRQHKEAMKPLYERSLSIHNIPNTAEGVLSWLSDSTKAGQAGALGINIVLSAGFGLDLITPADVLKSEAIKTHINAALNERRPGQISDPTEGLRKTLNEHKLMEAGGFNSPEVQRDRKSDGLKHLADVINKELERTYSLGVGAFSFNFNWEKEKLINLGDLTPKDISESPEISSSLVKLSKFLEGKVSKEGSMSSLEYDTKQLAEFLKKHGLEIPKEAKSGLERAYAKKFVEWTETALKSRYGGKYDLEQMAGIHKIAQQFGLNISGALVNMEEFKQLEEDCRNNRKTPTNY
jgi:hypothetical protein